MQRYPTPVTVNQVMTSELGIWDGTMNDARLIVRVSPIIYGLAIYLL